MTSHQTEKFLHDLRAVLRGISHLDVPVLAALDGLALGGGLELALAADIRVGSPFATPLGFPETVRGIIPGAGGTARLPRTTSIGTALLLALTGRSVRAEEAYARGILDVWADKFPSPSVQGSAADDTAAEAGPAYHVALELAAEIASNAPLAVRAAKKSISGGHALPLDQALALEAECYQPLLRTGDRVEGLRAFREKRRPRYQGK